MQTHARLGKLRDRAQKPVGATKSRKRPTRRQRRPVSCGGESVVIEAPGFSSERADRDSLLAMF
jgi:hypothetical protein